MSILQLSGAKIHLSTEIGRKGFVNLAARAGFGTIYPAARFKPKLTAVLFDLFEL